MPGGNLVLGVNMFTCIGWRRIIFGSETDPLMTAVSQMPKPIHSNTAQESVYDSARNTYSVNPTDMNGLEEMVFYTYQDINDYQNSGLSQRRDVTIIVNNVPV